MLLRLRFFGFVLHHLFGQNGTAENQVYASLMWVQGCFSVGCRPCLTRCYSGADAVVCPARRVSLQLQRRHEQMKKNLEAQHKELEEKRRVFEDERANWETQQRLEQQKLEASR